MTREEAKRELLAMGVDWFLERDKSGKGWICPLCGSGSGTKGTGISQKEPEGHPHPHFTCWACGEESEGMRNADALEVYGLLHGFTKSEIEGKAFAEVLTMAIKEAGLYVDDGSESTSARAEAQQWKRDIPFDGGLNTGTKAYPLEEESMMSGEDARSWRGLTVKTLERFDVKFCGQWLHPKNKGRDQFRAPYWIIPTGGGSYTARYAGNDPEKPRYLKVGKSALFNAAALDSPRDHCFVTEGEIDAMSVIDAGGEAIALGSLANKGLLLHRLKEKPPKKPLILMLDNDKQGQEATQELAMALEAARMPFIRVSMPEQYKDPSEWLQGEKGAFTASVGDFIKKAKEAFASAAAVDSWNEQPQNAVEALDKLMNELKAGMFDPPISTGFDKLDEVLEGGLYAGLYVIGAISSLGKTTFCLQVADYIAASGREVFIFSLEMAKRELIAKSLSRLSLRASVELAGSGTHGLTTRDILSSCRYAKYSSSQKECLKFAADEYRRKIAPNVYLFEGVGNIGVQEIAEKVKSHVSLYRRSPVVLIDYLQILAPVDMKATDKQNTDKAVLELKRLSRDYSTPVIGISSFNRDNYNSPVNLSSFKESGAIEYSADVLIGLQYWGIDGAASEGGEAMRTISIREVYDKAKEAGANGDPIEVQLKVLKNRNGRRGDVYLEFMPRFNRFSSGDAEKIAVMTAQRAGDRQRVRSGFGKKKPTREELRASIEEAFSQVTQDGATAEMPRMLDVLDLSGQQLKNKIRDLGLKFSVDGDTVTRLSEEAAAAEEEAQSGAFLDAEPLQDAALIDLISGETVI